MANLAQVPMYVEIVLHHVHSAINHDYMQSIAEVSCLFGSDGSSVTATLW